MEDNVNKKSTIIFAIVVIVIIAVIVAIIILKIAPKTEEQIVKCIASESRLYVSRTCSHCAEQKQILGNYTSLFNMTDCLVSPEICSMEGITRLPTWIIDGQKYEGIKTIEQLKSMTGC